MIAGIGKKTTLKDIENSLHGCDKANTDHTRLKSAEREQARLSQRLFLSMDVKIDSLQRTQSCELINI